MIAIVRDRGNAEVRRVVVEVVVVEGSCNKIGVYEVSIGGTIQYDEQRQHSNSTYYTRCTEVEA